MTRRRSLGAFVAAGIVVAVLLAFFVSPHASSSPDGLEKVSIDKGFEDKATDHAMADSPLADYGVEGVDNSSLSTGLAGIIGVGLCFAIGGGLLFAVRALRRPGDAPASADASS